MPAHPVLTAVALALGLSACAANEKAVREIIAAYKERFQQEAVFRARSRACISL